MVSKSLPAWLDPFSKQQQINKKGLGVYSLLPVVKQEFKDNLGWGVRVHLKNLRIAKKALIIR